MTTKKPAFEIGDFVSLPSGEVGVVTKLKGDSVCVQWGDGAWWHGAAVLRIADVPNARAKDRKPVQVQSCPACPNLLAASLLAALKAALPAVYQEGKADVVKTVLTAIARAEGGYRE